jgi:hypothetical protein
MHRFFKALTKEEHKIFRKLNTPQKIQDFLESTPINFEGGGDTLFSPRSVLRNKKAHCLEGALFASAVLMYHGKPAILLDLQPDLVDDAHTVALYKRQGSWGAISKTNHAVLRFRDPVYKTPRELAMSYFHEYFLDNGFKTLRTYTIFNLNRIKKNWVIDEQNVWYINEALDNAKYKNLISMKESKNLRRADDIEIKAGKMVRWKKK